MRVRRPAGPYGQAQKTRERNGGRDPLPLIGKDSAVKKRGEQQAQRKQDVGEPADSLAIVSSSVRAQSILALLHPHT